MATLVARADDETRRHMSFVDYTDADGNAHPVQNLDYCGLGMFGPRQAVDPITRKFSLRRI
jgi:hypothetical protein